MQRKVSFLAFMVTSLLALALPSSAQSNLSDNYDQLFLYLTLVSAAVLLLVVVLWIYFMYQYRETNEEVERKEISHSTARKLEVGWTVVAIIIVVVLMALSYPVLFGTTQAAEEDAHGIEIVVEGTQNWQWKYHLENGTVLNSTVQPNGDQLSEITLNVDTTYTFIFYNSANFIHSYFVPELNIKMDVLPGVNNTYTFEITETGHYDVFCAEFCGPLHSNMKSSIFAVNTGGII